MKERKLKLLRKEIIILLIILLTIPTLVSAVKTVDPEDDIYQTLSDTSEIVVTGEILSKESLWINSTKSNRIYTKVTVSVDSVSKGKWKKSDVLTAYLPGGKVGVHEHVLITDPVIQYTCDVGEVSTLYLKRKATKSDMMFCNGLKTIRKSPYVMRSVSVPDELNETMRFGFEFAYYNKPRYNGRVGGAMFDDNDFPISWKINPNCPGSITATAQYSEADGAFDEWENDASSTVDFSYGGLSADDEFNNNGYNVIFWGTETSAVAACNLYITSDEVVEFDICLNDDETWVTSNPTSSEYDIQRVLQHETGHSLVLNDLYGSFSSSRIMYGTSINGKNEISLTSGDIAGVQYLYPIDSQPSVSITSHSDNDNEDYSFSVTASVSCPDGIDTVQCRVVDYDGRDSATAPWQTLSYNSGTEVASGTITVPAWIDEGKVWLTIRATSDRAGVGMYGYDYCWLNLAS